MATKVQLEAMLDRLTEEPLSQDEMGGCVFCGGTPEDSPYGYATKNFDDHYKDCEWVEARKLLGYGSVK